MTAKHKIGLTQKLKISLKVVRFSLAFLLTIPACILILYLWFLYINDAREKHIIADEVQAIIREACNLPNYVADAQYARSINPFDSMDTASYYHAPYSENENSRILCNSSLNQEIWECTCTESNSQ